MRGGYIAPEFLRDTSCCVGSVYNSGGINVKECAGYSKLKFLYSQQTYHRACGLKSTISGCGRRLDQSEFRPMAEVSFPVFVSPANAKEKRALLTGNMLNSP